MPLLRRKQRCLYPFSEWKKALWLRPGGVAKTAGRVCSWNHAAAASLTEQTGTNLRPLPSSAHTSMSFLPPQAGHRPATGYAKRQLMAHNDLPGDND